MPHSKDQNRHWIALMGHYSEDEDVITFHGEALSDPSGQPIMDAQGTPFASMGIYMSNERLTEGEVEATVEFSAEGPREACEIILYFDPADNSMVTAGLGTVGAFNVRYTTGQQAGDWRTPFVGGDRRNIRAGVPYRLRVRRVSNTITMYVDEVLVARTNLPMFIPASQVGLWCLGISEMRISHFVVASKKPQAFVVMQFSPLFNALYKDVIQPVCDDFGVEAVRADDTPGPGLILQDIVQQIEESTFVIAEITPPNPNVFWEVGYAHALRRPTILIADRETQLPFDVSGFRTLLYENSVAGTKGIADGLRDAIDSIMKSTTE